MNEQKKYRISQIFYSMQGEGQFTGLPCVFVRFFGCNLQCNFGGSSVLPNINSLDEFVVSERGCDSGYAWMQGMEKFTKELTIDEIVKDILKLFPVVVEGEFGIVYTGGEPMLHQDAIYEIQQAITETEFANLNYINHIIETNGTIAPEEYMVDREEFHFSISPKLYSVTNQKAGINIPALSELLNYQNQGYSTFILKFVMNNEEESWKELQKVIETLEDETNLSLRSSVYIMPMGATKTQQESEETREIVLKALSYGYKISARLHVHIFGNEIAR